MSVAPAAKAAVPVTPKVKVEAVFAPVIEVPESSWRVTGPAEVKRNEPNEVASPALPRLIAVPVKVAAPLTLTLPVSVIAPADVRLREPAVTPASVEALTSLIVIAPPVRRRLPKLLASGSVMAAAPALRSARPSIRSLRVACWEMPADVTASWEVPPLRMTSALKATSVTALSVSPPPALLVTVAPTRILEFAVRVNALVLFQVIESTTVMRPPSGAEPPEVAVVTRTGAGPSVPTRVTTLRFEAGPPLSDASLNGPGGAVISESPPLLMVISAAPWSRGELIARKIAEQRRLREGFMIYVRLGLMSECERLV